MSLLDLPIELQCLVIGYFPTDHLIPIALSAFHWQRLLNTYFQRKLEHAVINCSVRGRELESLCLKLDVLLEYIYDRRYPAWNDEKANTETLHLWACFDDDVLRVRLVDRIKNPDQALYMYFMAYDNIERYLERTRDFIESVIKRFETHRDAHIAFVKCLVSRIHHAKSTIKSVLAIFTQYTPPALYLLLKPYCDWTNVAFRELFIRRVTFIGNDVLGYEKQYTELLEIS